MMKRKRRYDGCMCDQNGKQLKAVDIELMRKEIVKSGGQGQLSVTDLNCYFPKTCDADEFIIPGIVDKIQGGVAQARITRNEPQQNMRIKQQVHFMYSSKS